MNFLCYDFCDDYRNDVNCLPAVCSSAVKVEVTDAETTDEKSVYRCPVFMNKVRLHSYIHIHSSLVIMDFWDRLKKSITVKSSYNGLLRTS